MSIHEEAESLFFADPRQRSLALNLGEAFDITYARESEDLSFWLAEADPTTSERFGLTREVLVIYSPFPQTDARVLTAIDEISSARSYRNRIDQGLVLLVHAGDADRTAGLIGPSPTEDPERGDRVIVALRAADLASPHRGDIYVRSAIARALGGADLFGMSSPVTSERYFFGRQEIVRQLLTRALKHQQNSGLFGLRKTGKTSVLFALMRALQGEPVRCEYIDCHSPGLHAGRWWQLLQVMAERLGAREPSDPPYRADTASARFNDDLRRLLRSDSVESLLVMLDEVEYITQGVAGTLGAHWDEDFLPFWQTIRATHQETQGRLTFVVAGVNPTAVEKPHFRDVPNPIFQLATPYYLEPLTVNGVRTMVRTIGKFSGLKFGEDVYPFLQAEYGGHPYLIRTACSEVWRRSDTTDPSARTSVSTQTFSNMSNEIRSRLELPIRDILLSLVWWYPDEYGLLQILASGDVDFVRSYLHDHPDSVLQFARYGIIKINSEEFAVTAIRDFLREHGDSYKAQISPFARSDVPPELLPATVDIDALGDLFEKRTEIEAKMRKVVLLYLRIANTWDDARVARAMARALTPRRDRPDPTQLFIGRPPNRAVDELYVPDLEAIILDNWRLFAELFDNSRARFEMNMHTLNVGRRADAHSKPFTPEELADFANSYGWMLNRLAPVRS